MKCIVALLFLLNLIFCEIQKLGTPQFELKEGECSTAMVNDLVWQQHCIKIAIPFISREGSAKYSGEKKIYCIIALSEHERTEGSTVQIVNGGLGLTYVEFNMKSEAYIKSFTAALRFEYGGDGITIQHLAPMFVNTKMNAFSQKLQRNNLFVPDPEDYARYAVMTLGKIDETSGYWTHGIQTFFTKIPPVWLRMYIGAYLNFSFRKDYFKKNSCITNQLCSKH